MSDWHPIIAKPSLEGTGWGLCVLPLILLIAALYVVAKNFRLTMAHPPQKRGKLYWVAVAVLTFAMLDLLLSATRFWRF